MRRTALNSTRQQPASNRRAAFLLFLLLAASGFFSACQKTRGIPTTTTYTFHNSQDVPVSLSIYKTATDYLNATSAIAAWTLQPGEEKPIDFDVSGKYWIDWYSADYSFNNWVSLNDRSASPSPQFTASARPETLYLTTGVNDTARSVLLNGNQPGTNWQSIPDGTGDTYKLSFRKDFTGTYTHQAASGATENTGTSFTVYSDNQIVTGKSFLCYINDSHEQTTIGTCSGITGVQNGTHTGRDTLRMQINGLSAAILLVRQK